MKVRHLFTSILFFLLITLLTACSLHSVRSSATPLTIEQVRQMAQQTLDAKNGKPSSSNSGIVIVPDSGQGNSGVLIGKTQIATIQNLFIRSTNTPAVQIIVQPTPFIPPQNTPTVNYVQPVTRVCDRLRFVDDVTIPDDTNLSPNQPFRKTWRIQNAGSCTWTPGYQLIFDSGHIMNAPFAVNLPYSVAPDGTIDISVDMTAPNFAGAYQGNWKMRNLSGSVFGTSNNQNNAIWVKINVTGPAMVTAGPGVLVTVNSPTGNCSVLRKNPPDWAPFNRGEDTDFYWEVVNTSTSNWTRDTFDIAYISGLNMLKRNSETRIDLPYDVPIGGGLGFAVDALLPQSPGNYTMTMGIVRGFEVICTMDVNVSVLW